MKSIVVGLALLTSVTAHAQTTWEHFSSGDGTAFEERWVVTEAIASMSSDETLASDMHLGAALQGDGGLFIWVAHASSEICKFADWKLAVDKTVIPVNPELREDTKATALFPTNDTESVNLLELFREGEKIAVRFHAKCDNMFYSNYIGGATMTYSLEGSNAALQFLTEDAPEVPGGWPRHSPARNSAELAAYQSAIAHKIARNWAIPASATEDTECVVRVRQDSGGVVISADIDSCNGDDAVRRSIKAAVMRASPLPEPSDPDLFQAELRITLRPYQ